MGVAVGIDLGTTNTVVAAVRDGRAVTLPDDEGRRLIPSVVSFHPNGSVLVGEQAKERRLIDPTNTIYSVKRLIGRSWGSDEVQQARSRFPFELREGAKNSTLVVARGETYALPEMSAFVLRRAKAIAEKALGETVDRAVITVPANFNDLQRASTKVAGKLAGLEILRILNEPTAAALAYGQTTTQNERLAVYDLGGGTFDITLLDLSGNVFEVLATAGDTALGGDDIDLAIADVIAEQIVRTHRFDPRTDVTELAKLRIYAEKLKQELSSKTEATIEIDDIGRAEGGEPVHITFKMTREELERETADMIDRTFEVCRFAIETVGLSVEKIDRVILVGGPTRMPIVQRKTKDFFAKSPALKVNPDEVVALGAAIQAHVLDRGRKPKATLGGVEPALPIVGDVADAPRLTPPGPVAGPAEAKRPPPPPARATPTGIPSPSLASSAPPSARLAPAEAPAAQALVPQRIVGLGDAPPPPSRPAAPPAEPTGSFGDVLDLPKPGELSFSRPAPELSFGSSPPPPKRAPEGSFEPLALSSLPPAPTRPPTIAEQFAADRGASAVPRGSPSAPPLGRPQPRMAAPLLIDVTPLSLRVETVGGYCDSLISANTSVPCDRTRTFLTAADAQTTVIVRVAQGESNRFGENTFLGELELTGLVPAPRGETQIAVTFEIDADGILNVKAKDGRSGRQTQARLQLLGAQTDPGDVDGMMKRQQRHAIM